MGSTSLIPIIHFKNSRASYFLRPENFLSLLSMRKGPNCPVPNTKFKQGKESVETGSPAAVPWLEDSRTPVSNSSFVWCLLRFFIPRAIDQSKNSVGEEMCLFKMGKDDCWKGRKEEPSTWWGWTQDSQFQGSAHMWGQKCGNWFL